MVGANHWIRSIETYTFLRWLTLVSASYASSTSGQAFLFMSLITSTNSILLLTCWLLWRYAWLYRAFKKEKKKIEFSDKSTGGMTYTFFEEF